MVAMILLLGLSLSDVLSVDKLSQWELTVPKPHDIVEAFRLYDLRSTGPLPVVEGAVILLELQSFCFTVADITDGILAEAARIEVLRDSAASLPAWITERWKSQDRKEAEAAAWQVEKLWSDIESRENDYQDLFQEGRILLEKAETTFGLVRKGRSSGPKRGRLSWCERLMKAIRRT